MSSARQFAPLYTVDDYSQWEGDWELWDGIAIAMAPAPFGRHQRVAANLLYCLRRSIEEHGCEARIAYEMDWIIRRNTVVRPDLVILCDGIPDRHIEAPPAVIVEILSSSTRHRDTMYKRQLYEEQGVGLYLMVDPDGELSLAFCDDCHIRIHAKDVFRK